MITLSNYRVIQRSPCHRKNEKYILVIDEHLSLGLIANTTTVMGITLGSEWHRRRDPACNTLVALRSAKKLVNKLTGSMPLPR